MALQKMSVLGKEDSQYNVPDQKLSTPGVRKGGGVAGAEVPKGCRGPDQALNRALQTRWLIRKCDGEPLEDSEQ